MTPDQVIDYMNRTGKYVWNVENKKEGIKLTYTGYKVTDDKFIYESVSRLQEFFSQHEGLPFQIALRASEKEALGNADQLKIEGSVNSNLNGVNNNNNNSNNNGFGLNGQQGLGFITSTLGEMFNAKLAESKAQDALERHKDRLDAEHKEKLRDIKDLEKEWSKKMEELKDFEKEIIAREKEAEEKLNSDVPAMTLALGNMVKSVLKIPSGPQPIAGPEQNQEPDRPMTRNEEVIQAIVNELMRVQEDATEVFLLRTGAVVKLLLDKNLDNEQNFNQIMTYINSIQ